MKDKQLIKQEIERIIEEETPISKGSDYYHGAKESMEKLLQFINSLPEEPVNGDLEIENYINRNFSEGCDGGMLSDSEPNLGGVTYCDLANLARHFSEWGRNHFEDKSEMVSEDLEEAAKHYLYGAILYDDVYVGNPTEEDCIRCFKAGAEWQKQQMMKGAVDAIIFSELKSSDGSLFQTKSDRFRMNGVKISDRIKVIPIKTEQNEQDCGKDT